MIGYKGFNKDLTRRGFQYEIGKTYTFDGNIELCESGFHFCKSLGEVLRYYDFSDGNRFCEIEAIGEIVEGENKCVTNQIKIIREIEITAVVLKQLSKDKNCWVREAVAMNPHTFIEDLIELSKDKDNDVRKAVAGNPNIDIETLKQLSKDKNWKVRLAVAENQNTDSKTLKTLSKDEDDDVRYAVANHPNTDIETLKKIVKDECEDDCIRHDAILNLNNREEN